MDARADALRSGCCASSHHPGIPTVTPRRRGRRLTGRPTNGRTARSRAGGPEAAPRTVPTRHTWGSAERELRTPPPSQRRSRGRAEPLRGGLASDVEPVRDLRPGAPRGPGLTDPGPKVRFGALYSHPTNGHHGQPPHDLPRVSGAREVVVNSRRSTGIPPSLRGTRKVPCALVGGRFPWHDGNLAQSAQGGLLVA